MSYTRTEMTTMAEMTCWCGTLFSTMSNINEEWIARRIRNLYCPLGHSMIPRGKTERDRRIEAEAALARERDRLEIERRSNAATRGHLTRIRNRVANGVCPWCQRSFTNVRRHVESKHPDHATELAEATT